MSITVEVHDNDRVYHPGDHVTGIVRVRPIGEGESANVEKVRVELAGHSVSLLDETSALHDRTDETRVSLFRYETILFNGPYTIASVQEWHFEFSLPQDCRDASDRQFQLNDRQSQQFNHDKLQQLPPSMRSASRHSVGDNKTCKVEYYVRGILELQATLPAHRQREAVRTLRLWPYGEDIGKEHPVEFATQVLNMKFTSPHLDPSIGDRELKTKEKLKAKLSSHVPSIAFKLLAAMPKIETMYKPFTIKLSLQDVAENEKSELPIVLLREFTVKLIRQVALVTNRDPLDDTPPVETWGDESVLAQWAGSAQISGELDLRTLYDHESLDWWNITPTFRTFNINQQWIPQLIAKIEVARTVDTIHVKGPPCTLLSPYYKPLRNATDSNRVMAAGEAPPSYEQAAKE